MVKKGKIEAAKEVIKVVAEESAPWSDGDPVPKGKRRVFRGGWRLEDDK